MTPRPVASSSDRCAAALGVRLLRAIEPAADRRDHRADRRGPALPGRYAAAALGCGRARSPRACRASLAISVNPPGPGSIWRLTRARPVAGDAALRRRIAETIDAVLHSPRDPGRLLVDVADMRRRIAAEHPRPSPWDLKNRPGGLIDLEFIAQYLMLREAAASPQILRRATAEALRALGGAGMLRRRPSMSCAMRWLCCARCRRC